MIAGESSIVVARLVLPLSVLPLWLMSWLLRYALVSLWKASPPIRLIVAAAFGAAGAAMFVGQILLYRRISGTVGELQHDTFFMVTWCTMTVLSSFIGLNSSKVAKARQHRDSNRPA